MLWQASFVGYWPVGTLAIVRAATIADARALVRRELPEDLKAKNANDDDIEVYPLDLSEHGEDAIILLDGNY